MDSETAQLAHILLAEFPELPLSTIEAALRENDNDVGAARRALYALPSVGSASGDAQVDRDERLAKSLQKHYDAGGPDRSSGEAAWLSRGSGPASPSGAGGNSLGWTLVSACWAGLQLYSLRTGVLLQRLWVHRHRWASPPPEGLAGRHGTSPPRPPLPCPAHPPPDPMPAPL